MPLISRACPETVVQSLENSCWAAVLESWSIVEPRIQRQHEQNLIDRWGEGPTGGITPARKLPTVAAEFGMAYTGLAGGYLENYLRLYLHDSHIFCAYTLPGFTHAVLIYMLGPDRLAFFDPHRGHYRVRDLEWIEQKGPFAVLRKV